MSSQTSRIHSLDGLRALSIALVLLGHLGGTRHSPVPLLFERYANTGVLVFFVISGYLITSILLKEHAKTGDISLREFYRRRFFRIFPAAYAFITLALVFAGHALRPVDVASAYGYGVNYDLSRPWAIGHLWSLAVEEQFYLLWPALLLLFIRKRRALALAGVALGPAARILFKLHGASSTALGNYFPCVADTLATGCLLAMLEPELERWARALESRWFALVPLVVLSVPMWTSWLPERLGAPAYQLLGVSVMNVGIALCVARCVRKRYALLNRPFVAWVGVLSYSLYLWQQPFIDRHSGAWYAAFPANVLLAFGCAAASYYLVERPFLRLRDRLARPAPPAPEAEPLGPALEPGS